MSFGVLEKNFKKPELKSLKKNEKVDLIDI
jgi:hypothetical protein